MSEVGKSSNEWCIDVSSWLRLLVVSPFVWEAIVLVRTTNHCTDEDIRVWRLRVQDGEAFVTLNLGRVACNAR